MQYIGRILGFFLGYKFLGGLFGGILGVILGYFADKKLYELGSVSSSVFGKRLTRQALFMQTTFAVLGHIAKSKGRVTEEDIQLARHLMNRFNLDAQNQQLAQNAFNIGKEASFPLRQVIQEFRLACGQSADLQRLFLEVQLQAAFQDGVLDQGEQQILMTITDAMGISDFQFQQMLAMRAAAERFRQSFRQGGYQQYEYSQQQSGGAYHSAASSLDDAYQILGVTADADQTTVKRAYRKLMNEYHPDKLVAKGLPPEMMDVAKEKAQAIQAAYDVVCKAKGWK